VPRELKNTKEHSPAVPFFKIGALFPFLPAGFSYSGQPQTRRNSIFNLNLLSKMSKRDVIKYVPAVLKGRKESRERAMPVPASLIHITKRHF
jgi:hypothetical protein